MEELKRRALSIFLSLISLVVVNFSFAQTSRVEIFEKQYFQKDTIDFTISNNYKEGLYYHIELEKYDSTSNFYYEYSRNVFSREEGPAVSLIYIEQNSQRTFSFELRVSIRLYLEQDSYKNDTLIQKVDENIGVFRLKVYFGTDQANENSHIYSEDFVVK